MQRAFRLKRVCHRGVGEEPVGRQFVLSTFMCFLTASLLVTLCERPVAGVEKVPGRICSLDRAAQESALETDG